MAANARLNLAENESADGAAQSWPGGQGLFMAEATWGGGTAKLQVQSPQGTWIDYPSGSLSADGMLAFTLPPGQIRVAIATATAVYAYAIR